MPGNQRVTSRDGMESTQARQLTHTRRLLESGLINGVQVSVVPLGADKPPSGAARRDVHDVTKKPNTPLDVAGKPVGSFDDLAHKLRLTRSRCDVITRRRATSAFVRPRPLSAAALIDGKLLAVTGNKPQSTR